MGSRKMIVADLMTRNPTTVQPGDTLEAARRTMAAGRFRHLPVVEKGTLLAVLSDHDLGHDVGHMAHTRVNAVMTPNPITVEDYSPVERAAHLMIANKVGGLPVLHDGKLVGIITATDILGVVEAMLGENAEGSARIELDLIGSGEVTAATTLVQSICPLLGIGTYTRSAPKPSEVLFFRVPSASVEGAARALEQYGFKVLVVYS
jgi:acetoin utilization protein AcuB